MARLGQSLLGCLIVCWMGISIAQPEPDQVNKHFHKHPENLVAYPGEKVMLSCVFHAKDSEKPADMNWLKDGAPLGLAKTSKTQKATAGNNWLTTSELVFDSADKSIIGKYQCVATLGKNKYYSGEGFLKMKD